MLGRTNTGGGGGGLNFKVICNPQPSTAKENTIWVDTDIINNYYFSATQPGNMVDYDVWFPTGTSSSVEFNALKKNGLQVCPLSAKQYVGGALVDVTAKSYQGGKWVDWLIYLYNSGDKCENITGGWTTYNIPTDGISGAHPTITDNADSVKITLSGGIGQYGPKNKINLSNYNTLEIKCTVSSTLSIRIFKDKQPTNINATPAAAKNVETGITPIDISGLSGEYYIFICLYPNGSWMTLESLYLR